ncbi:MAG: Chromate resistance protein ChrB [Syntrophothermus sp.]
MPPSIQDERPSDDRSDQPDRPGHNRLAWLALAYKVPSEPSRKRVHVWRRVKELGAIYLQQAVCLLPESQAASEQFRALAREIRELDGEAVLVRLEFLEAGEEEKMIGEFRRARDQEYAEVMEQARRLLEELEMETDRRNFTFAEVEENEEDLAKLQRWLRKVKERDYFGGALQDRAKDLLQRCDAAMQEFTQKVFEENTR